MTKMNSIKETLTKGFVLMALTGTLVSKNPIKFNNDVNIMYAATNIEQTKKDALKELKGIYKTYSKKYYTSKNYDKLTKYYNKGVSVIKNAKSENSIDSAIEKYGNLIKNIKPTILVKYQNKLEKKLLKTYKKLITKNTYSESNLEKIESLKEEGVEKIHSSLTKTQSKKAKNNYITKLNDVKTLVQQVREDAINFINDNRDISRENKEILIEQIGNMNEVENITSILEEYGYTYEEEEEYVETITVEQIENKIKELLKKYPKYTEDEIRALVATANMDFVNEEDISKIFKANNDEDLKNTAEILENVFHELGKSEGSKCYLNKYPEDEVELYGIEYKIYEDLIKLEDVFIYDKLKKNAKYIQKLIDRAVLNSSVQVNFASLKDGDIAAIELGGYIFDEYPYKIFKYPGNEQYSFENDYIYKYDDKIFNDTGAGYIMKYYINISYLSITTTPIKNVLANEDAIDEINEFFFKTPPFIKNMVKRIK